MNHLIEKLNKIKLILLDVDGTMTDGGIYVYPDGSQMKRFFAQDGEGIRRAIEAGYELGIISAAGLAKDIIQSRAKILGIARVHADRSSKLDKAIEWMAELSLLPENVAYMGDDIIDAEVMVWSGLACAPKLAHKSALAVADYITEKEAGYGAVREFIDLIMETNSHS
jgi:3-deoxy-D-manno-octulosonate 8-phosphate phosphatase (KDO 8-P phosphatase)